jgi:hypothetical protein
MVVKAIVVMLKGDKALHGNVHLVSRQERKQRAPIRAEWPEVNFPLCNDGISAGVDDFSREILQHSLTVIE